MQGRETLRKYFRNSLNNSSFDFQDNTFNKEYNLIPLPWRIWPYEGKLLLIFLCLWVIFGLFILGSASWWVANKEMGDWSYFLKRQFLWYLPGSIIFFSILNTNIRDLLKVSKIIFYILTFLIGITIVYGSSINGSSRWLILGPIQIQPSELIKPFAILESANLFAHWHLVSIKKKLISLGSFGLLLILIMRQPNLSTAGLTGIVFWIMALCGGVNFSSLFSVATLGTLSAYISTLRNEYQMFRVRSFINPWQDAEGHGYQLIQSLLAIGSGGFWGKGFGLSVQKLQYLPIQHTDFIFAIYAEEFGLIGSSFLLFFLAIFSYLTLRISIKCRNNYTKLVGIGCGSILITQSFIHIAVTTGSMPTTGLPLPFVSYGGNSLLSSLAITALLLRCSLESTGLLRTIYANKRINQLRF